MKMIEHSNFLPKEDKCSAYMQTLQTDRFLCFCTIILRYFPPHYYIPKIISAALLSTFLKYLTFGKISYCAYLK